MNRALTTIYTSSRSEEDIELRRGPWTFEEDNVLTLYIACHGHGHWNMLAKYSGLKRSGKSCRLRWLNYLKPDVKRGNLTIQEQLLILELHSQFGNRWSKIAQHLPGRTDNEIKNYWRTRVQKQAKQLKIDSDSKRFIEAVRYFWMPRLVEQIEQNLSSSSSSSTSSRMEIQAPSAFSSFQPSMTPDSVNQFYNNPATVSNFIPDRLMSTHVDISEGFISNSYMAARDWITDDIASIWDMDELW